jgi:hypothetical protein
VWRRRCKQLRPGRGGLGELVARCRAPPPGSRHSHGRRDAARETADAKATPTAGGTATAKAHAANGSADEAPIEPEHQRTTAAPNTVQRIGPCSATPPGQPAGDCLASGDSDDETDKFTLDAAAVVAEEAVERKEARRVKPWLSELDCTGVAGAGRGPAGVEEHVEEQQDTNIVYT